MGSTPSKAGTLLPVGDLKKRGGGAWKAKYVNWKKSAVTTFQGQPALKVFYGRGSGTSSDPGVGGLSLSATPAGLPARTAVMSLEVYFAPGWDWSKGGKVGGLFVGFGSASGYEHSETGASHRLMWKANGGAISYIYPPDNLPQKDPTLVAKGHGCAYFGDLFKPGTLKVGSWNSISIEVRINTFTNKQPNPDGVASLTINGVKGVKNDIRWARSPNLLITSLDFNTFFGGPDPAKKDCVAYFRNFRLATGK